MYAIDRSQVARKIISCIKSHYNGCYPNWSHTSQVVRDLWFEEFKKLCWWESELDGGIRRAFNKITATHLSDIMDDARKAWVAKKRIPTWIPPSVWEEILNFWVSSNSFKKLSEAGKKNRAAENSGFGPSLYIGGSRSLRNHARKIAAEKREESGISKLFLATHQKKGKFVCWKAQNIYERFSSCDQLHQRTRLVDRLLNPSRSTCGVRLRAVQKRGGCTILDHRSRRELLE